MKNFLALIGGLVVVGFICLFMIGVFAGTQHTQNTPESSAVQSVDTPQSTAPAMDVSADRLYIDYHRNEVAADARYKGRLLSVTGTVTSINKDAFDKIYLVLGAPNEFEGVHAKLQDGVASWAGQLEIGQSVTVQCEGGMMIIGSPMLENCVPGQRQAPPPVYTPKPSASEEPAQAPVQTAVYSAPAASQVSVDQYEDNFLLQMKAHWAIPAGTPPNTRAGISVSVAPDGRVYGATIQEASAFPALDRSCLDALNRMSGVDPTPDGKVLEISFDCTSK